MARLREVRRTGRILALSVLALLASAVLGPASRAEEGPSKGPLLESAEHNFKWTLPSKEWSFSPVGDQEKASGYVARAARHFSGGDGNAYVDVYVYVSATGGLTLNERMDEMLAAAATDFESTDTRKVDGARLSGLEGRVAMVRGTSKTGGSGFYLWYGIQKSDRFHHLLIKAYNGAERQAGLELDAVRRGYRLIKGAGPEEEAPKEEPKFDEGDGGGTGSADNWPAKGPKREGNVVTFPTWNMKWKLPEGGPWQIKSVSSDEAAHKDGLLLLLEAKLPGMKLEKKEEGEEPTESVSPTCEVRFLGMPAPSGATVRDLINDNGLHNDIQQKMFDKVDITKRKVDPDFPVGNVQGAVLQMGGQQGEGIRFFRFYIVFLKGKRYQWQMNLDGDKYADDIFRDPLKALMEGVEFLDTKEPVRGPWALESVTHDVSERGKTGEGKEIPYNGFAFKRPKGVNELEVQAQRKELGFQVAMEARSPDGQGYVYAEVVTRGAADLARSGIKYEDMIDQRKTRWEQAADTPVTVTKGKDPWFDASFGPAKGMGYRFTGNFGDTPFVERGYVVKNKQTVFFIKFQFGGKDAEKTMDKAAKAIEKAIKFDK